MISNGSITIPMVIKGLLVVPIFYILCRVGSAAILNSYLEYIKRKERAKHEKEEI